MALGKRYVPQKRIAIALPSKLGVTLIDPAIDVDKSDLDAYWDSDFDQRHIALIEGEQPSWFTIRPLTRRQRDAIDAAIGERSSISWYIRCGLVRLDNYTIQQPDGSLVAASQPKLEKRGDLGEIATEEWLDEINFPTDLRVALFHAISKLSEASLPLSRPSKPLSGETKSETPEAAG